MVRIVYDKIINFCGLPAIPCVIVGQKRDLSRFRYGRFLPFCFSVLRELHFTRFRQVSEKEGQELAVSVGSAWIETSARNNENVGE